MALSSTGRAVAVAAVGMGVAIVLFVAVLSMAGSGDAELKVEDEFAAGSTEFLDRQIDADGPFPLSDVSGGGRPIIVQHLGDDLDEGWLALDARPPGRDDCVVAWDAERRRFASDCDERTFPPDGGDLARYPTRVDDGELFIDLKTRAD